MQKKEADGHADILQRETHTQIDGQANRQKFIKCPRSIVVPASYSATEIYSEYTEYTQILVIHVLICVYS